MKKEMDISNVKKYHINAQQPIPVPYGSMLHKPPTNLLLLAAKQEQNKKAYLLTKNVEESFGKSSEEWSSRLKKIRQKVSNRTRQKNKRGDNKVESNDSPEIPAGERHQTSPASLRGTTERKVVGLWTVPSRYILAHLH